ncbi:conserved protein of unknown function [Ectopseudomonas oleovorans]|uniref:Uncharacterized protein n=1 Tax=Ectopseudomonas oleovorans TaxID=301 RepID=A0A653B0C4_ECTOL|nr:conserved protein of unknown function [Pseudomonas oleovorans]
MPVPPIRTDNWAKGANNIAKPERLPAGFVRELVNLDPSEGGQLEMRADYGLIAAGENVRIAVSLSGRVVFVDGGDISCYSADSDSSQVIGSMAADGDIAGAVLNGQAYLVGAFDSLRTDGREVKPWAVPAPGFDVELITGALPAGIYKVAVTAFGADGEESGVEPVIFRLAEGQAFRVVSDDSRPLQVYVSPANGATLYSQGPLIGGAMAITVVDDQGARLTTAGLVPLPVCSMLAAFHSLLVGACGNYVVFTAPMTPHLMDPVAGFFQYPEPPTVIAPTEGGVYVVADRTYFVTGLDTGTPSQVPVLDLQAVRGSAVQLPDKRVAWFTRYGMAIGNAAGEISLPNRQTYAPDIARSGAAGVLENNGIPMVVTTMRGEAKPNNLATGDFADLEIADAL